MEFDYACFKLSCKRTQNIATSMRSVQLINNSRINIETVYIDEKRERERERENERFTFS